MEIKPHIGISPQASTQPTGTTTLAAVNAKRVDCTITLAVAGGPFYVKRGSSASSTNFDYMLINVGDTIIIDNYCGIITVNTNPAGAINVCEFN